MKKIVFLDIDGTLVTPNYPLSDFVKKGIKKARENGHLIFLCTGRNRVGIESIMSDDFDGCICSAGGYLEIKGEMIETTYLDKEEVEQARKVFEQNHILYNLESTYMTFASEELRHYFAHALLGDEGTNSEFERLKEQQKKEYHMVDISKYQDQGIHKLCFIAFNREDIEKIKECNGISEERIKKIPLPIVKKVKLVGDNLEFTTTMPRIKLDIPKRQKSMGFINIGTILLLIAVVVCFILGNR